MPFQPFKKKAQSTDFVDMSADPSADPSVDPASSDPYTDPSSNPPMAGSVTKASVSKPSIKGKLVKASKPGLPAFLKAKKLNTKKTSIKRPSKLVVPGLSALRSKLKQYASLNPSVQKTPTKPIGSGVRNLLKGM